MLPHDPATRRPGVAAPYGDNGFSKPAPGGTLPTANGDSGDYLSASSSDQYSQPPSPHTRPATRYNRPAHSNSTTTPDDVVEVALEFFSARGFEGAKLEHIARESGMSKRMIHYHFGDKKGLYLKALSLAITRLQPDPEAMKLDSSVPVEGVRKLVDAIYDQFAEHPQSVRMMIMENIHNSVDLARIAPIRESSTVALHLDKLLMLGQDAGAFRPGISADDVFYLIASLCFYRVSAAASTQNIFSVNLYSPENQEAARQLVVDTVLAFLTANIPDCGQGSYLIPDADDSTTGRIDDIYSA